MSKVTKSTLKKDSKLTKGHLANLKAEILLLRTMCKGSGLTKHLSDLDSAIAECKGAKFLLDAIIKYNKKEGEEK